VCIRQKDLEKQMAGKPDAGRERERERKKKHTNTSKKHRQVLMKGPAKRSSQLILALVTDCASFQLLLTAASMYYVGCVCSKGGGVGRATGTPGSGTDHRQPLLRGKHRPAGGAGPGLGWAVFSCALCGKSDDWEVKRTGDSDLIEAGI
jgi:hypothetical protein